MKGSNGYSVFIEGSRQGVAVTALEIDGFTSPGIAVYEVRSAVSPEGIEVVFGSLGRISVTFRPSERVKYKEPPPRCRGMARKTVYGVFVGRIRFRGEQGYTEIDADRAKGSLQTSPRWRCKSPRDGDGPPLPSRDSEANEVVMLEATSARGRRVFSVAGWRPPEEHGLTMFSASTTEWNDGIQITRAAFVSGRERTFTFDEVLRSATVAPPSPFSGTATFLENPDGTTSWEGSLRVDLPGANDVPLGGESFTARLYRP